LTPGVVVGGSHPYLDPSGYRSHLMFQLTQAHYAVPNLYNNLLEHYLVLPLAAPANAYVLGKQYDFQLIYEHSAQGLALSNPDYRYAYLPDDIDLSSAAKIRFTNRRWSRCRAWVCRAVMRGSTCRAVAPRGG